MTTPSTWSAYILCLSLIKSKSCVPRWTVWPSSHKWNNPYTYSGVSNSQLTSTCQSYDKAMRSLTNVPTSALITPVWRTVICLHCFCHVPFMKQQHIKNCPVWWLFVCAGHEGTIWHLASGRKNLKQCQHLYNGTSGNIIHRPSSIVLLHLNILWFYGSMRVCGGWEEYVFVSTDEWGVCCSKPCSKMDRQIFRGSFKKKQICFLGKPCL